MFHVSRESVCLPVFIPLVIWQSVIIVKCNCLVCSSFTKTQGSRQWVMWVITRAVVSEKMKSQASSTNPYILELRIFLKSLVGCDWYYLQANESSYPAMLCCCYCFSPLLLKVLLSYMSPTLFVCLQHLQTSSFPRCHLPLPSLSRHFFMPEIQKLSAESRKNSADVVNSVEVQTSKFYSIFFFSHPGFNNIFGFLLTKS